MAALIAENIFQ